MAFTKGLAHQPNGMIENDADFAAFEEALTQPGSTTETQIEFMVPKSKHHRILKSDGTCFGRRVWESPLAGMAYDNEGPDPDMVAMAPAPKLGESELCAEMVENYAMALVRDLPFSEIDKATTKLTHVDVANPASVINFKIGARNAKIEDLVKIMNELNWFKSRGHVTSTLGQTGRMTQLETRRQNARGLSGPALNAGALFRGSSAGCKDGPYISQFLLQGAGKAGPGGADRGAMNGMVAFGAQSINQKIFANAPGVDWMTAWSEWLGVQDGIDLGGMDVTAGAQKFIETPRDLATYVHVDQLYQAYFIACLMLLENQTPGDPGFPEPNGTSDGADCPNENDSQTRAAFATFGGPHILSQMTEVASRALRAVRRQKFQIHRRARPERLGAMVTLACTDIDATGDAKAKMQSMLDELGLGNTPNDVKNIMDWINQLNDHQNAHPKTGYKQSGETLFEPDAGKNYLLPMAFPEGSPMHPAYGAGHATVAGACTTVLKAFFSIYENTADDLVGKHRITPFNPVAMPEGLRGIFEADTTKHAAELRDSAQVTKDDDGNIIPLTTEGELNKLAANIAIGRNFAGVHYYTDYYDSLRMGERVAIGMLKEHLMMHPEPVSMHLRSFDSDNIVISGDGNGGADVHVWNAQGFNPPKIYNRIWPTLGHIQIPIYRRRING